MVLSKVLNSEFMMPIKSIVGPIVPSKNASVQMPFAGRTQQKPWALTAHEGTGCRIG